MDMKKSVCKMISNPQKLKHSPLPSPRIPNEHFLKIFIPFPSEVKSRLFEKNYEKSGKQKFRGLKTLVTDAGCTLRGKVRGWQRSLVRGMDEISELIVINCPPCSGPLRRRPIRKEITAKVRPGDPSGIFAFLPWKFSICYVFPIFSRFSSGQDRNMLMVWCLWILWEHILYVEAETQKKTFLDRSGWPKSLLERLGVIVTRFRTK